MPAPLFLLLLAGGGFALYRHLNPPHPAPHGSRQEVNGRVYELRPGLGYTDVYSPLGVLLVRYETDTRRVLTWAKNDAALTALGDLGLSQA